MHYFAKLITGKEQKITKNPENIIREHFKNTDPARAEEVIEAIKEMYKGYTIREKTEAAQKRRRRENQSS